MKNTRLTGTIASLCVCIFILAGCSGIYVRTQSPTGEIREAYGFSFITDRQIEELDVKTPEGGFKLQGAKSEQSKALDVAKAALDVVSK